MKWSSHVWVKQSLASTYTRQKKSGTKWSEWDMLVTFVLCWVVLFDGPWLYHLEHVGPKEVHQLAGNVTWCQWQKPFRLFTLLSLLGEPVDPVVKSLHFPIWGYALQVGCRSVPDRDGSMWREEICEGSPETKGSNVTYRLNNSTPCKKDKKYDRFVLSQYAKFSCGMDCRFAKQDWFNTGIHVLCFATIWAQQGVFGVMTSSRMSWDVLTVMPALHPRLGVESGGVHLQLRRPQSQQMALSLGLVLALGSVVLVGATCCLPPCQCFRGRNLHVMIPTLKMGKAKRESNMFWVARSVIAARIAEKRLRLQPFTMCVVRFGASTKQPKTAFFGGYRTWLNLMVQKGVLQVVVAAAAHLVPASLALLKQNQRLPTLAAILERSMSTRGTFKAGFVDVCHYWRCWSCTFVIYFCQC